MIGNTILRVSINNPFELYSTLKRTIKATVIDLFDQSLKKEKSQGKID